MKITVRLYRQYDLDLIYMSHYDDFSVAKTAKACLQAYGSGNAFRIAPPVGILSSGSEDKTTYEYHITLDEKKDASAIKLLRSVRERQKNSFIKNLMRGYLAAPFAEAYLKDEKFIERGNEAFLSKQQSDLEVLKSPKKDPNNVTHHLKGKLPAERATKPEEKVTKKHVNKKNAITELGEAMITSKKDDELPENEKKTTGSVLFPEGRPSDHGTSETLPKDDGGFDLFETIDSMTKNY